MQLLTKNIQVTQVPCSKCKGVFNAGISTDIISKVEIYPFPNVLLHSLLENNSKICNSHYHPNFYFK